MTKIAVYALWFLYVSHFTISNALTLSQTIPGPRSFSDKIAIVGAGPAGVHMALLLKNLGLKNIDILEKSNRIGGKSYSINYRGAIHEMGTLYLAPGYEDNVIPLVQKYLPQDLTSSVFVDVWYENVTKPVSFETFVVSSAMQQLGTNNVTQVGFVLVDSMKRYIALHKKLFGDYIGEIMPEPSSQVWKEINGTFLDFLKRNNLETITPIFYASHSIQGYGRLNEVACLYGLMWNTPVLIEKLIERLLKTTNDTGIFVLKSGFQRLWENIALEEKLNVKFNVDIKSVYRSKLSGYKDIFIQYAVGSQPDSTHLYDFLIWSPDMQLSLSTWQNKEIFDEQFYFSKLSPTYFTVAIINSINIERGDSPTNYFIDNVNSKKNGSLVALRNAYAAVNQYSGAEYLNNKLPNGNDDLKYQTSATYQKSDQKLPDSELKSILNESLREIGAREIEILYFKTWRYFPRFLPNDMEKGYLWRVIDMQGKYGMWYIGSSVCFESVKSVMEYNNILVRNMIMPNETTSNNSNGMILQNYSFFQLLFFACVMLMF